MPANRHMPRYHSQNNHGKSHESPSGVKFESMESPSQRPAQPPPVSKVDPLKPSMNEKQLPEGDGDSKNVLPGEKRFTQRSRLFVGNLPLDMSEEDFRKLFLKFGEISEIFVNSSKGFGFVRLDTRANAEKAKWELDGHTIKNRQLRIRFASHGAALSIKNLSPFVSNELLESAFSQFGNVERAVVIVDDRGRSTGRGIIEFARKASATKALQQISDGCFLLTSSPQAVVVKPLEQEDTEDGLGEKNIPHNQQYFQEREAPPRFAQPGNFEYEFSLRWKALDEMERQLKEQSEKTIAAAREKLELEMESAIHDHKTMMMKQDLMRRQEELRRLEEARQRELERRGQLEMAREDAHNKELQVLANRQEVLRAQVEGNYKQPMSREEQAFNRNQGQRSGGFGGNVNNPMMQEALAHEMLGSGQGGLGQAPTRQSRYDPGISGNSPSSSGSRGYPPQGPGYNNSGPGYGGNPRRGYNSPMDYDGAQKRRRY